MKKEVFLSIQLTLFFHIPATAVVTYEGTNGVKNQIFENSALANRCVVCHSTTLSGNDRNGAPSTRNFNTYTDATLNITDSRASIRINAGTMPRNVSDGTFDPLSNDLMNLVAQWVTDGSPENAPPEISTKDVTTLNKVSATLEADVAQNGDNTDVTFSYSTDSDLINATTSNSQSPNGSGGGIGTQLVTQNISGLTCGTVYYYRAEAINSIGSKNSEDNNFKSFQTSECNIGPTIIETAIPDAEEDAAYSFDINHTDPNSGDIVTYTLINNPPSGMTIGNTDGIINWTPGENIPNLVSITVRTEDGGEDNAIHDEWTFSITVNPVNDNSPNPGNDNYAITENSANNPLDVLSNDTDIDLPDDTLTISNVGTPNQGGSVAIGSPCVATVLCYNPAANFAGTETFSYTVTDNNNQSTQATVIAVVNNTNNPPTANNDNDTVDEDINFKIINVLTNDTDLDTGDTKEVVSISIPNQGGTATIEGTGNNNAIRYQPAMDFFGIETFNYTMQDAAGLQSSAQVTVTINPINDPPVITSSNAPLTATEAAFINFNVTVSDPDDDNNGSDISWGLINEPVGMIITSTGEIQWTSPLGSASYGPVTITVEDGNEDSSAPTTATFTININIDDPDSDDISSLIDNCPNISNTDQFDTDSDGNGDACDTDINNDGILETYINFTITQDATTGFQITRDAGNIIILASIANTSVTGPFSYQWTGSQITSSTNDSLTLDPSILTAGRYIIELLISATEGDVLGELILNVLDTAPPLGLADCDNNDTPDNDCDGDGIADIIEGYGDADNDFIPDYKDNATIFNNQQLQDQTENITETLALTTENGWNMRLGLTSIFSNTLGALVTSENIDNHGGIDGQATELNNDNNYDYLYGIYDFELVNNGSLSRTAKVVIPLKSNINGDIEYRKFNPLTGWHTFVVDSDNNIASTSRNGGNCPAPGDSIYQLGLIAGNNCIQLTLSDGGPNDADGIINGIIKDPGGVATLKEEGFRSQGGRGSIDTLLLFLVFLLYLFRHSKIKRSIT